MGEGTGWGCRLAESRSGWGSSQLLVAGEDGYQQGGRSECGQGEGQLLEDPQRSEETGRWGGEQRWRGLEGPPWPAGGRAWSLGEAECAQSCTQ